jgi:chloramphenicol O-acetyltransferase
MDSAQEYEIERDIRIRVVTAPYFCATKLEAFRGRGKGDYLASHDLEDLLTVVDGSDEFLSFMSKTETDPAFGKFFFSEMCKWYEQAVLAKAPMLRSGNE